MFSEMMKGVSHLRRYRFEFLNFVCHSFPAACSPRNVSSNAAHTQTQSTNTNDFDGNRRQLPAPIKGIKKHNNINRNAIGDACAP